MVGFEEMQTAVAESTMAYNHDMNESGVTPAQAAIGKQPRLLGDVLGGFSSRLAEHGVISEDPHVAKTFALRETAKVAMVRLHFSRSIRRAGLAKSRSSTQAVPLEPGMIVYFWREQRANSRQGPQKKRLTLRRWHGPALLNCSRRKCECLCFVQRPVDQMCLRTSQASLNYGTNRFGNVA